MERSNPWWMNEQDAKVTEWEKLPIKWVPEEIKRISLAPFSLNFLYGARQVGKTTLLKLLVKTLIDKGREPKSVFYLSCDELIDYKELAEAIDSYLESRKLWHLDSSLIILDEITFVEEWWRTIKARIDNRVLSKDVLVITGSASLDLLRQREHFPGRRGQGVDIKLRPLSFRSYVKATSKIVPHSTSQLGELPGVMRANQVFRKSLEQLFKSYLETGGFPLPIREKFETGSVSENTRKTLLDGLRGDWLRAGRSEKLMKEVIDYLLAARGTPVSWLSISKSTSIASPHTARVYVETLNDLLLSFELELLAPNFQVLHRKNRKIHFTDPFIYDVLSKYALIQPDQPAIVEATVASHLSRGYETYYWRNGSEVDVIALDKEAKKQFGFEIKWNFKIGRKPQHIRNYVSLDQSTIPEVLSSLAFD